MNFINIASRIAVPLESYFGPGESSHYVKFFEHHQLPIRIFYTPKSIYRYDDHANMARTPLSLDQFVQRFLSAESAGRYAGKENDCTIVHQAIQSLSPSAVNIWCYDSADYNSGPQWVLHDCCHHYILNNSEVSKQLIPTSEYIEAFYQDFDVPFQAFYDQYRYSEDETKRIIEISLFTTGGASNYFDFIISCLPDALKSLGAGSAHSMNKIDIKDHLPDILPIFFNPSSADTPFRLEYRPFWIYISQRSAKLLNRFNPYQGAHAPLIEITPTGKRETERLLSSTITDVLHYFDSFLKQHVGDVVLGSF